MLENNSRTVYVAKNLQDILYHINSIAGLQILGSSTWCQEMGEKCVTVRNIPELTTIEKHERFIDFGSAVTLSKMISLGRNNMPSVLFDALTSIGTPAVRNLATLGGNICAKGQKLTLFAPLLAMDARLEFKSPSETRFIQMSKFTEVPKGFVLTKIRVPVDDYEIAVFSRTGPASLINESSGSFTFLADTQKDFLGDLRIAFAGKYCFRSKELENNIVGAKLPFSEETIELLLKEAEEIFCRTVNLQPGEEIIKDQFINLCHSALEQLS